MAIKTDSTVDDPEMLDDGTQYLGEYRPPDYQTIGADGGLFGGGLGPAYVLPAFNVSESPVSPQTLGDIFGFAPNVGYGDISEYQLGGGATPAIVPAGGIRRETVETPQDVLDYLRGSSAKMVGDQEAFMELAKANQLDPEQIDYLRRSQAGISSQEEFQPTISRPAGQGGIPLILPIPGLDPASAAILTAAGLIFSGGKIAQLNPQNPVGSVAGAVQGIGQTGQNIINVATGEDTLGNIWSGGTAPSTGTGTATNAAATGGQQTTGAGAIGAVGGIFGGGTSGAGGATGGQQTTTGGTVGVTPGALGGSSGQTSAGTTKPAGSQQVPSTGGPYIYDSAEKTQNILGQILAPSQAIQQQAAQEKAAADANAWITGIVSGALAKRNEVSGQQTTGVTATSTSTTTSTTTDVKPDASGYIVTNTPSGVRIQSPVQTVGDYTVKSTPQVDLEPDVTSGPPSVTPKPSSNVPTSTTPTTTSTAATPIVINAPTTGYTLPQTGTPAQRNLYTEAGTTLSSLASPMQQFQIGVDASGKPIYGTIPSSGGQPLTLSEAIAQGYGGLARGMRQADVQNLFGAIGAATGRTPTAGTGYQSELNRAAAEQTAAANAALRMGNIMDAEVLSARAQALRQQANPELFGAGGALPQYTQQAREQVMRDVAALRTAEAGQLTPEQIRNAQQAAREAYGARGQVFSEGAKAQEVLNRQQMIQQQQQLARQNLAQSMGQLGQGVAYQTANIFDPMAATLGAQYGMQSQNVGMNQALYNQAMGLTSGAGGYGFAQQMINPFTGYAQDVYGTNVNAANAAQIAAANRQAALEAAKMGQTGTYAQALGGLIASGGLGQIQSGVTSGIQGLLSLLGGQWPTGSSSMITPTVARPGT